MLKVLQTCLMHGLCPYTDSWLPVFMWWWCRGSTFTSPRGSAPASAPWSPSWKVPEESCWPNSPRTERSWSINRTRYKQLGNVFPAVNMPQIANYMMVVLQNLPEIILISCDNDLHLCREYFLKNIGKIHTSCTLTHTQWAPQVISDVVCCLWCPDVHNAEFILTGVLTQKLDYESYPLLPIRAQSKAFWHCGSSTADSCIMLYILWQHL